MIESAQAAVVENEPTAKDGGEPKANSVKPSEAQEQEDEDELVL